MPDGRLDEPREWIGRWWRPDQPEKVTSGVLTFDPAHGIRLRLIGGWQTRATTEWAEGLIAQHQEIERWPIVHGLSGHTRLTLIEPWAESSFGNYGEDPHDQTLRALTVLEGCHLDSADSPVFVGAGVTVENLTGWANRGESELNLRRPKSSADNVGETFRTATALVGDIEATLHSLSGFRSMSVRRDGRSETRRTEASVAFSSVEPRDMELWFSMIGGISDLVSISTMSACADLAIHLVLPPAPDDLPSGGWRAEEPRIVRVYQEHIVKPDAKGKAAQFNDFVLTEADLPWAQLLPAWMSVRDRFAPARSLILGLRYITEGYLGSRVVTAVAAAEAFHRGLDLPAPIPKDEFDALRKALLAAVPKDQRGWVNDRVQWNEPSLKQRLIELTERPGKFMKDLVPDPDKWARVAGRARNDLAHRGDAGEGYEELHAVVEVTAAVVVMNLLNEVGVPEPRLARALEEHAEFRHAAELARRYFSLSATSSSATHQ